MSHLLLLPIVLPALTGALLLLTSRASINTHRAISMVSIAVVLGVGLWLMQVAHAGERIVYSVGNWPVPFGIVLVVDRLSAMMGVLTSVLALGALAYARNGWDLCGRNFLPIFQFQLMGIQGAFLTGDVFNLFVFFEILLISSYGLMMHGGGPQRSRAGLLYVVYNLAGSAFFIIGLGLIYGSLGSVNIADMAVRVGNLGVADQPLVMGAGLLLLLVFLIKGAAFPMHLWLPSTYGAASPPVAALFAIMTKVGIYAVLRVHGTVFAAGNGELGGLASPWLIGFGLLTLIAAALGAMGAKNLRALLAYLVIGSVGTMLLGLGVNTAASLLGTLYYLIQSTLVMAAGFLLAELISQQRGAAHDDFIPTGALSQPVLLSGAFFVLAIAAGGLPPLSGFLGKFLLLDGAMEHPMIGWMLAAVLIGGLLSVVALSRAGTMLFWKQEPDAPAYTGSPVTASQFLPIALFLGLAALMVPLANPLLSYLEATATQLLDMPGYVHDVFAAPARPLTTPDH